MSTASPWIIRAGSIEQNVAARKLATEITDFALECAKEEQLDEDHLRLMFSLIVDLSCRLVGDEVLCESCQAKVAGREAPRPKLVKRKERPGPEPMEDDDLMPFGKHKDERMEDVPEGYLRWLLDQDWIDKWPAIKAYAEAVT